MSFSDRYDGLEEWLRAELGRPLPPGVTGAARRRVMERVRAAAGPSVVATARRAGSAGHGSRLLGLALAAGLSGVVAFGATRPFSSTTVLDTAQGRFVDTVAGALADTLRAVRFMLIAPTASRVAVVGDFNAWDPRATPLARAESTWSAVLALAAGRHRYAFVVDDTQWIADPSVTKDEVVSGRRASVLEVPGARE